MMDAYISAEKVVVRIMLQALGKVFEYARLVMKLV